MINCKFMLKYFIFYLKFLLTKHYKKLEDNEDAIMNFVSYFIKTLRKEFEKGENNNAKSM